MFGFDRKRVGDPLLEQRIVALQAELSNCRAQAGHRESRKHAIRVASAVAMFLVGFVLGANNVAVRRNIHDLVSALGLAATRGYIDAGEWAYQNGKYAAALRVLQPLAEAGNPRAQTLMGLMYYHGRGVSQDDSQAAKWFRLAAAQGEARARFNLGVMHADDQGVPQDYAEALKWYRLAADQGRAPRLV